MENDAYILRLSCYIHRNPLRAGIRDHRDLLIYLLWESGRLSNQQIGSLLGISCSNVSRRISEFRRRRV
ncbi:MAG: winged helix-turn-helix transcriptional regulator [Desulfosarcina sp.]|nr:winged helix-turn-helix transcriptional regulator [Desulfobacterales bacterium]